MQLTTSVLRRAAMLAAAVPLICAAGAPGAAAPPPAGEAANLQRRLAANPEDLDARGALIGLYFHGRQREAWLSQVFWTIEHHPEADFFKNWEVTLDAQRPLSTTADFERAKALWLEQAERYPGDARVQANAALGVWSGDFDTAMRLMGRARALDPGVVERAAALYVAALRTVTSAMAIAHPESPTRPDPVTVRARLETSGDAALIGLVGRLLKNEADSVVTGFAAVTDPPPDAAALLERARHDAAVGGELLALAPGSGRSAAAAQPRISIVGSVAGGR